MGFGRWRMGLHQQEERHCQCNETDCAGEDDRCKPSGSDLTRYYLGSAEYHVGLAQPHSGLVCQHLGLDGQRLGLVRMGFLE